MKHYISFLLLALACDCAISQPSVKIISPKPNEEICLGGTLPISARITNRDTVTRTLVARITITNIVTNKTLYDTSDTLRNLAPGATIDTTFPDYVTNPNNLFQLGSFHACTKLSALDALDSPISDWPFADSSCVRIFGIRTVNLPFYNTMDNYSKTATGNIPDQTKWVSLGAQVFDGEIKTWDPPPPRDEDGPVGADSLHSPVVRLDRSDANDLPYAGIGVGDTLASFPSNLSGQKVVVLTFDFMRSEKRGYPALWDAGTMIGPEHAVFNMSGQLVRPGDSLIIEFKEPDEPGCNPAKWNRITAIGGGHDVEFQSFWMRVVDTTSTTTIRITGMEPVSMPLDRRYFNSKFRFRLRLKASYSGDISTKDDDDPWYIDNLTLLIPRKPDHEVMWARVVTPYSKIPHTAAAALPVYCKIKNTMTDAAVPTPLTVVILDSQQNTVYSQTLNVTIKGGHDSLIRMPDWNAQSAIGATSKFTIRANIPNSFAESHTDDNITYSIFYLNVEQGPTAIQEFALDDAGLTPQPGNGNDIPSITGVAGSGIGFSGGSGSYAMKFVLSKEDTLLGARLYFGSANSSPDAIGISVLRGDSASCIPADTLHTFTDTRKAPFDQFTPYYFPQPIVLPAGIYWLSASQLTFDNFMMGGDLSRGSGVITLADNINPRISPVYTSPFGSQSSPTENNGNVSCAFAVETPAGSGQWLPWMPTSGWWPANSADVAHQALIMNPKISAPFIRAGTYMPMIRPMVGSYKGGQVNVISKQPNHFAFEQSHPNPFDPKSGSTELNFILTEDGEVSLIIYDAMGREIRPLIDAILENGEHTVRWDGKDANGSFVASGVYVCRLSDGAHVASIRIVVVR